MQFNSHVLGGWNHVYDVLGEKRDNVNGFDIINKHEQEEEEVVEPVEAQIIAEGSGFPKNEVLGKKEIINLNR